VIEHIPASDEDRFVANIAGSIVSPGVAIIGLPSLESQPYASPLSKEGHVNCKSAPDLKRLMLRHFHGVFIISMNDEVVHTGFYALAHYLFALCVGKQLMPSPPYSRIILLGNTGYIGSRLAAAFQAAAPGVPLAGHSAPSLDLTRQESAAALEEMLDPGGVLVVCAAIRSSLATPPRSFSRTSRSC
jgi:hypothetical protein